MRSNSLKNSMLFLLLVGSFLFSCTENKNPEGLPDITDANSSCVLAIEGMMCEKGCKATIEQRLSATKGVISCDIEYTKKIVSLDFDNNYTSAEDLIKVVNSIADGAYQAKLLEESVYVPVNNSGKISTGEQVDEVSVSDYNFQLPDFSRLFSNFI